MSVGLKVEGAGEFLRMKTNAQKLDNEIRAAVRKLGAEYRAKVVAELSKPGTGRLYKGATGRRRRFFSPVQQRPTYRASAPGRPPARMSGTLLRSVRIKFPRKGNGYSAVVFEHRGIAFYRGWLEFGAGPAKRGKRKGAGGERAPRPVFTPLQKQLDGDLTATIQKAIDNFVRL